MKPRRGALPYWLDDGPETCDLCTHSYVLEVEVRCAWCDRGVCQHCVVLIRATRETVCSDCHGDGEEEG